MAATELASYGYALCGVGFALLALRLLPQRGNAVRTLPPRTLLAATVVSAAWAFAGAANLRQPSVALGLLAWCLELMRYGLWFALLLATVRASLSVKRWRTWQSLAAIVVSLNALTVVFGALHPLVRVYVWLALPVLGLALVEHLLRTVPADYRWHAKPMCLALATTFLFDLYMASQVALFGRFDPDTVTVRGFAHALAVPMLFVSARREFAWVRQLQVSRAAAFHSAALLLVGAYLLLMSAVGYYIRDFGGTWGGAVQLGLVFAGLVMLAALLLSRQLRAKVSVFVGKNFFRYRYDYRTEWLRFTEMLTAQHSPQEMGDRVIQGLAAMVHSPAGSLWTLDQEGTAFAQSAVWGTPRVSEKLSVHEPLCAFLAGREWIIDLDEYRAHPQRHEGPPPPSWLLSMPHAWAIVPLVVTGELTGFVVVARPHASPQLNWEVRDLLKTASRQAASMLALMRVTEALLEVRKFDAFNRMSAFVVHDLKNIVAQLSLMMQNAKRLKDNPEFQEDMLITVESSLEKMRRLMLQLREGQAPVGSARAGVELLPVLERLRRSATAAGRIIEVEVDERVVARGHEERIERVLGHIMQNALDATSSGGSVRMALGRQGSHASVVVTDSGCGMTEEFMNLHLFKPFRSTKDNGMGIGAYESNQYVRELGGSIAVKSAVGQGTEVTVLLPLIEAKQRSDLQLSSAK